MIEVTKIKTLDNYLIWLRFSDGEEKVVNLEPFIGKGFTKELLDRQKFKQIFIEPGGGIAWENGFDFCPNFLKELQEERHMA